MNFRIDGVKSAIFPPLGIIGNPNKEDQSMIDMTEDVRPAPTPRPNRHESSESATPIEESTPKAKPPRLDDVDETPITNTARD